MPQSPTAFLHFLADVRQSGALDQNVGPPVVHCSAGIGRSGTFCLVDTCLVLVRITFIEEPRQKLQRKVITVDLISDRREWIEFCEC